MERRSTMTRLTGGDREPRNHPCLPLRRSLGDPLLIVGRNNGGEQVGQCFSFEADGGRIRSAADSRGRAAPLTLCPPRLPWKQTGRGLGDDWATSPRHG